MFTRYMCLLLLKCFDIFINKTEFHRGSAHIYNFPKKSGLKLQPHINQSDFRDFTIAQ